jgi:large subunit ribosomal protein L6
MSKIGKQLVTLPAGATATIENGLVTIAGPRGTLTRQFGDLVRIEVTPLGLMCSITDTSKAVRSMWGTTRAHLANMVKGVSEGWRKDLELHGVGYRAKLKGKDLEMSLGYSHTIAVPAPEGISFKVEKEVITVEGNDVELVGQIAADIRALRKPEPYKGKGVRYAGEKIRRKVGKVVGSTTE